MEILRIEDLSFKYPGADEPAVDGVELTINEGDFVVVCGESGCGKTTLLKLIKKELTPVGEKKGRIFYRGMELDRLDERSSAAEIGFVLQNPDNQIVTDKVWHELAFGLENLGVPSDVIRRRVGEMASYFGIHEWFRKNTDELSGGQKQMLNLASVMVMQPRVLILDEPTSQLDPIAASDFISTLKKLNSELGLTIILAEHRLDEVFPIADRVLVMDKGRALLYDLPERIGNGLCRIREQHPMLLGLPGAVRIYNALGIDDVCPLTVREGRDFLERHFTSGRLAAEDAEYSHSAETAIELKNVWFRYRRELPDVMRGASLAVYKEEFFCILGGNGTGKTTALNVISGLDRAYRGKVMINGRSIKDYKGNSLYKSNLAYLPQNPQTVFIRETLYEDYAELLETSGVEKSEWDEKICAVASLIGIGHLLKKHPYDLSGGEQQKCALAKLLLMRPTILLLDEPTKGMDALSKQGLKNILANLKRAGTTILAVTHDVEFAAENADRCALFFDGELLSPDIPSRFFAENNFYTTTANRIARRLCPDAVTCDQVTAFCKRQMR